MMLAAKDEGPMVHTGSWLVLVGIAVELLGALLLSIDAIGIERVRNAINRVTSIRDFITSKHPTNTFLDPARFFAGGLAGLGVYLIHVITEHPPKVMVGQPTWVPTITGAIFTGLLGFLLIAGLTLLAMFLSYLQMSTERKTAGVIGFAILTGGLILQFVGTLLDALHKT